MGESTTVEDIIVTKHNVLNTSLNTRCLIARYNETEYLPWENPDNIVSQDIEALVFKIRDLTLAVLLFIGGAANIINAVVFYKQGLQDRVNLCLFMLALSDELYLISGVCVHSEAIYWHLTAQEVRAPLTAHVVNNNLNVVQGTCFVSFILSAIIALERCYCVFRPLRYQTLMRTRTMALILLSVSVLTLSVFFVVCYRYWIQCVYDPVTGAVFKMSTGGGLYRRHKVLIDYLDNIVFGAAVPGGVMIVVISTTIITTVKLRHILIWRTKSTSSLSAPEVSLTKMLIGNSVLFILCICPSCVFRVACLFMPEMTTDVEYYNFYLTTLWISEGSGFINSSFNLFIYYLMGSRYRETFWTLFGKGTKGR